MIPQGSIRFTCRVTSYTTNTPSGTYPPRTITFDVADGRNLATAYIHTRPRYPPNGEKSRRKIRVRAVSPAVLHDDDILPTHRGIPDFGNRHGRRKVREHDGFAKIKLVPPKSILTPVWTYEYEVPLRCHYVRHIRKTYFERCISNCYALYI